MTVSTTDSRDTATGDGATVEFTFDFKALDNDDVAVYVDEVLQGSGYTVARNTDAAGGTVTFDSAPADAAELLFVRVMGYTQETALQEEANLDEQTLETMTDRVTMLIQQVKEITDRCIQLPISVQGVAVDVPTPAPNTALVWDEAGTALTNSDFDTLIQEAIADAGVGTGNVVGPASSTSGNLVKFSSTNGRLIDDVGFALPALGAGYKLLRMDSGGNALEFGGPAYDIPAALGAAYKQLRVNSGGSALEFGGAGYDFPAALGAANQTLSVNGAGTALEFGTPGGSYGAARSLPTSGAVTKGFYYHDGNWTAVGTGSIAHGTVILVNGDMSFGGYDWTVDTVPNSGGLATTANASSKAQPSGGGLGAGRGTNQRYRIGGTGGSCGGAGGGGYDASESFAQPVSKPYSINDFFAGSGGSGGTSDNATPGAGGNGGGAVRLLCTGTITFNGNFSANGAAGVSASGDTDSAGGGGGSGGIVDAWARTSIVVSGGKTVSTNGGAGGASQSAAGNTGGGGGGIIRLIAASITVTGTLSNSGGAAGTGGASGGATGSAGPTPEQITATPQVVV